ncbi:MAG: tyrosine-type recombinase/integrase [Caulobacteraceae bacterium]
MEIGRARISKRTVDAVSTPAEGESRLWDTDVRGFFLRVYSTGRRVYAVKYRVGPLQRVHTLGVHGSPLTPETARKAAVDALDRVRAGEDPAAEKKAAREALTVNALIDRYLEDGPATKPAKRASTWAIDGSNLNRHIRPLLGRRIANSVTKSEAARAIQDITEGKTAMVEATKLRGRARVTGGAGTARRTRTTAAAMFAWGVEHGLIKNNPFAGVKLTTPPVRERFLSREEAGRLLDALNAMEADKSLSRTFADALRVLLLTGARKMEALGLRWREVDFERRLLVLPPERTKAGGALGERRITLSPAALSILSRRKTKAAEPDDFVFPAAHGEGHIIGLRRAFLKVCAIAGLAGLRIHDLRHSFASFAIADGASLFLVSKLLGHASARTTERYAHLGGDPLQDVAATIGRRLMDRKDKGGVGRPATEVALGLVGRAQL